MDGRGRKSPVSKDKAYEELMEVVMALPDAGPQELVWCSERTC